MGSERILRGEERVVFQVHANEILSEDQRQSFETCSCTSIYPYGSRALTKCTSHAAYKNETRLHVECIPQLHLMLQNPVQVDVLYNRSFECRPMHN